jgi:hypothetical protein
MRSRPGDETDPDDVLTASEEAGNAPDAAATPREREAEEEAAKLGDFA